MNSKRLLVEEVAPLLDGHYQNDDLPDGAWFQVMVDTVEMHLANRRSKPEVEAFDIVHEYLKGSRMSQIVKINGVDHMIVQPSRPFMNSGMITNVLASGRKLGVNLSTGALVIVTPKPEKVFIFEYDGSKRKIASDRQVGLLQIEDQLDTLTKTLGNRVAKCDIKFYIKEDNKIVFLTSLIDNQQGEFLRQVGYAYSKFI